MSRHQIDRSEVPNSEGYQVVGKLTKAHGIRGEIFIHIFSGEAEWLDHLDEIRLIRYLPKKTTDYIDLKLSKKRFHKGGLILSSPDIADRNRAEELKGCFFQVPNDFFTTESEDEFYLQEILGYQVVDQEGCDLGIIKGFGGSAMQDLIEVEGKDEDGNPKKVSIPLVDDFITEVNHDDQTLLMNLPPGLLDV